MKERVFKYKGQLGSVEPDLSRGYLYGKLLYIDDLIAYEAQTIPELEKEFQAAVDEYLEDCADLGVEPNKPFKGTFNVRIGPELHRKVAFKAASESISINDAVTKAIDDYVNDSQQQKFIDDMGDQIRRHVYQASLYASSVRTVSEPKASQLSWSETFQGLRGTYSINQGRIHEH